jgi:hypothetical protein
MSTVAVMQPYFVPYAGYFRLFAAADIFVMFDCVQFPRRGWVHRNRFLTLGGQLDWLTLPIQKCARETRIRDLVFAPGASARVADEIHRFTSLAEARKQGSDLIDLITDTGTGTVADYLCAQLARLTTMLGISRPIVRSSALDIDPIAHGQDRVIAVARALGATQYVNSPGGRALYEAREFGRHGIELRFLVPYTRSTDSILALLLTEPPEAVAAAIRRETLLCT